MSSSSREIAVARKLEAPTGRSRVPAASVQGWLRRQAGLGTAAATMLFLLTAGAGQRAQAQTPTFTSVYSFQGGADGAEPFGGVVEDSSGNIYGTTEYGGAAGDGTVFKVSSSGESVCYSFTSQNGDGAYPVGGLLLSGGSLYGTANAGGLGNGNVFEVPTSCGTDSVLYNFGTNSPDGADPTAGLILAPSGNLYGTTLHGGDAYSDGTVFALDPSSGAETYLHQFQGSLTSGDGANPYAGLISDKSGNLYGTTENGGAYGAGTVFKIDTTGNETLLYSFTGSPDGAMPYGSLVVDSQGNLYGTTELGGTYGLGTVFKIDASGNESVLYSFTGATTTGGTTDGEYPIGGLVMDSAGNLYGTTFYGGDLGGGTVFEISPSGTETQLHSFNGTDGTLPVATLMLDSSNVLWGTTQYGGTDPSYDGTVFKIVLPSSSIPFSAFSSKLNATSGPPPGFNLQAYFTLGSGGAIDPVAQGMTLSVGNYTVTIPSSTFTQAKKGWWSYSGTIGSASVTARISQPSATSYELQFSETGFDITSGPNPATITLTVGNNSGTTTASF